MDPFLKWAGGKRWLLQSGELPLPPNYTRFVEPFLGSGAAFFSLAAPAALLSDVNSELINLYRVIRDHPTEFRERLSRHGLNHSAEYYYGARASVPDNDLDRAARTLYLNRTCWNGLYRVNKRGEFNVPIGTKTNVIYLNEDFNQYSARLKSAELSVCDFEKTVDQAGAGDFLFVDPPYTVKHNFNGFIKYNEELFGWSDQIRLRDALVRAIDRGASIALTNADHDSIRELYTEILEYHQLQRHSVLSGLRKGRGPTTEALFLSY
jgi:DNA adenine methylase